MSGRYAKNTDVPVEKSRMEVERILARYGASSFAYGYTEAEWMIVFEYQGRRYRFQLRKPDRQSKDIRLTPQGYSRSAEQVRAAYEQAERQRWRAMALLIKAKLEAVDLGIETFDQAFLSALMLPNGSTVGEWVGPQVGEIYERGQMPAILPGLESQDATFRILPGRTG